MVYEEIKTKKNYHRGHRTHRGKNYLLLRERNTSKDEI